MKVGFAKLPPQEMHEKSILSALTLLSAVAYAESAPPVAMFCPVDA
jgi:hypothetical protein